MKSFFRALAILVAITVLAGTAVAQSVAAAENQRGAEPRFEATQIVFKPGVGKVGFTLSVTGPNGYQYTKTYRPGVNPVISVRELEDGLYGFELRIATTTGSGDAGAPGGEGVKISPRERGMRKETGPHRDSIVESGHFRVEAGGLVLQNVVERGRGEPGSDLELTGQAGLPDKDVCHYDDLIVDGSLCVGFDCTCGMSFGYDTIALKENNLRIFFDDTSTVASYPRNDWRIVINDSTNGGASYFGIEDSTGGRRTFSIEAGAPSHSLYVDDYGRVGLGTSTPVVELHIKDSDTPTYRLEQDSSSGWTPQTWDIAGNETNFFIRDVTNGSKLPFRIRPGAPSNSIYIDPDGDVGIGTSSPDANVDIESNSGAGFRLTNTGSGGGTWDFFMNANTSRFNIEFNDGNIPFKIDDGADNNLLQVGIVASDQVDINGDLVVSGTITPDFVFEPGYQLESIDEHAEYMWTNKHLPAVGAATVRPDGSHAVNVGARSQGVLEELEKAHIYIEQLHATIQDLEQRLEKLENHENGS
jgi:hypothetical protein